MSEFKGKRQGIPKQIHDEIAYKRIRVSTLEQVLDTRVKVARDTWGYNSLGHKEAIMARKMLEQIKLYVDEYEISDVTFEGVHDELNSEE